MKHETNIRRNMNARYLPLILQHVHACDVYLHFDMNLSHESTEAETCEMWTSGNAFNNASIALFRSNITASPRLKKCLTEVAMKFSTLFAGNFKALRILTVTRSPHCATVFEYT